MPSIITVSFNRLNPRHRRNARTQAQVLAPMAVQDASQMRATHKRPITSIEMQPMAVPKAPPLQTNKVLPKVLPRVLNQQAMLTPIKRPTKAKLRPNP